MEDSEQIDLIDFSAENDNLIFNLSSPAPDAKHQSSGNQKDPQSFEVLGETSAGKEGVVSLDSEKTEQVPELAESEEPQRTCRTGKYNLRKSLAWDSAFFTSAGVLDPEELSSIMRGDGKGEKSVLPGIQEDIRMSSDSISTLESDNMTLENLEVELFEDIRASIQKSCKAVKSSCSTAALKTASNKAISSPKLDLASANQLKQKPVIKKMTGLQTVAIPKSQPKTSTGKQGSGKAIRQEPASSQLPKSASRIRESASSVAKPPKDFNKVNSNVPETTKRASLGANHVKTDTDNAKTVSGRGTQALKAPMSSGARRVLPRPSASLKPSSLGRSTVTKTQSTKSSTSDKSGSSSSDNGGKSSVATVRKKVPIRTINPPSSGSIANTPSRSSSKSKSISKNSSLSAYLMSSKISSNVSPASSISEWSSASASSSSSSANQRSSKSRTSVGSSSWKSLEIATPSLDLKTHSHNQMPDGQDNRGIVLPDKNIRRSVAQTGTLTHSASMRPSGLRMPSPKIGFFDGVKSVRTPNGTSQPHSGVPGLVSKTGAGVSTKVGKLPSGRVLTAMANIKPDAQKPDSPSSSLEKPQASRNLDVHAGKVEEIYFKCEVVKSKEYDEAKCDSSDMRLDSNGDPCLKDVKLVGVGGDCNDSNSNFTVDDEHHLRSNLHSLCKLNEKENVRSGDQVNGLSNTNRQIVESLSNCEPTSITSFETTSEISSRRTPLAVKNFPLHTACVDSPSVSADQLLEKAVVDLRHLEGDGKESIKQSSS